MSEKFKHVELELTLRRSPRPYGRDPEELLDYLLTSLGFSRNREMYREILMRLTRGPETSTELARGLSKRTTAIYHITKLVRAGIVVRSGSRYRLREESFERLVEELKRDVDRVFEDLLMVAKELDKVLNLPRR